MRQAASTVCNVNFDDTGWQQSTLPVAQGGLSLSSATNASLPAYASSLNATKQLVGQIIEEVFESCQSSKVESVAELELGQLFSCRFTAGRFPRHSAINNIIIGDEALRISVALRVGLNVCLAHQCRYCQSDGLITPSILEPVGLDRGDGRRPDGVTSFPLKGGKALAWDATCTDAFSTSNLFSTILNPGSASSAAEFLKSRKYSQLVADFEFVPVAVETSGNIDSTGCSLLTYVGRRISRATNDPRQMSYIFQQVSVAIIQGNALAITASSRKYAQELVERH